MSIRDESIHNNAESEFTTDRLRSLDPQGADDQGSQKKSQVDNYRVVSIDNNPSRHGARYQSDSRSDTEHKDPDLVSTDAEPKSHYENPNRKKSTNSPSRPLDTGEYPLSYEEELIFIQCGSVLKLSLIHI